MVSMADIQLTNNNRLHIKLVIHMIQTRNFSTYKWRELYWTVRSTSGNKLGELLSQTNSIYRRRIDFTLIHKYT